MRHSVFNNGTCYYTARFLNKNGIIMRFPLILVSPARAENIGAAARAMKTMGFNELRIVASDAWQDPAARRVAHGAGEILDNLRTFDALSDALADIDFSVATTARSRAKFRYYATPQQVEAQLLEKRQWVKSMALVFGREDSGLTNEELDQVDLLTGIPMAQDYPSLNLGQAVMVYCYQLSALNRVAPPAAQQADAQQLEALRHRFERLLQTLEVSDDRKMADWIDQRIGMLEQRDSAMLHRLLHDVEKKLIDKSS